MTRLVGFWLTMSVAAVTFANPASAVEILFKSYGGFPGESVVVDVVLVTSQGEEVAATQNDITFDDAAVGLSAASACVINPGISDRTDECENDPSSGPCKQLNRALDDAADGKRFRGLVLSLANTTTINDSSADDQIVLYSCTFQVAQDAVPPFALLCSNAGASDPDGTAIETTCTGTVIGFIERFATPTPTPTSTELSRTHSPTAAPSTTAPATNTPAQTVTFSPTRIASSGDDDGCQVMPPPTNHFASQLIGFIAVLLWARRYV